MPLKALLFDLDGTLIDSAPDLQKAVNKLLRAHGRAPISNSQTRQFVGNGAQKLVERAFRVSGAKAPSDDLPGLTSEFLAFYDGHECDATKPYEGVIETLEACRQKNLMLTIATNKPKMPTLNILKTLGFDGYFDFVIGGDEVSHKKPDPEMLQTTMDALGVTAGEVLMIGDSPNDIGAAKAAGIRTIAVSYGYRKVPVSDLNADHIVDHMGDILDYLD